MAAPHEPFLGPEARLPSFWLPPGAVGNGLPAVRWAEIAVVDQDRAVRLLAAFAAAGIPARMATGRHSAHDHAPDPDDTRIWVAPDRYADAEDVLLADRPE